MNSDMFLLKKFSPMPSLIFYSVIIDVSRIRTAIKLTQPTWTLASNHKAEHIVRPKWALVTPQ